jgi:hypothetical protein
MLLLLFFVVVVECVLTHGQLGMALAFPPFDVGGGIFTTVLEVAYNM